MIPVTFVESIQAAFGRDCSIYDDVLMVSPEATPNQFQVAYFRQGRKFMTDKVSFQAVCMAYEIVSHPEMKRCYDEHGWQNQSLPSPPRPSATSILKPPTTRSVPSRKNPSTVRDMRDHRDARSQRRSPSIRWDERVQEVLYAPTGGAPTTAVPSFSNESFPKKRHRKPKIIIDNLFSSSGCTDQENHPNMMHLGDFPESISQPESFLKDSIHSLPSGWSQGLSFGQENETEEEETLVINNVNSEEEEESPQQSVHTDTDFDRPEQFSSSPRAISSSVKPRRTVRDVASKASVNSHEDASPPSVSSPSNNVTAVSDNSTTIDPHEFFDSSFLQDVSPYLTSTPKDNDHDINSVQSDSLGSFLSDVEFEDDKHISHNPFDDAPPVRHYDHTKPPTRKTCDLFREEKTQDSVDSPVLTSMPLKTLQAYNPAHTFQAPNGSTLAENSLVDTSREINHSSVRLDKSIPQKQANKSFDDINSTDFSFKSNRSSRNYPEYEHPEAKEDYNGNEAGYRWSPHSSDERVKEKRILQTENLPSPLRGSDKQITLHHVRSGVSEITGYFTEGRTQDTDFGSVETEDANTTRDVGFFTCYMGSLSTAMTKCGEDFASIMKLTDEQFNSFVSVLERRRS